MATRSISEVLNIIKANPGIDRKGLEGQIEMTSVDQLTAVLSILRKGRGLIRNEGSRRDSKWFAN